MVEVRGVEPLSAKQSTQAATCLVYHLISSCCTPADKLTSGLVPVNLSTRSIPPGYPASCLTSLPGNATQQRGLPLLIKQPLHKNNLLHLLLYRMINEANRCPRHAAWISHNTSKASTPPKKKSTSMNNLIQFL